MIDTLLTPAPVEDLTEGRPSALFIGCHADDIEIGCGGTLAKIGAMGWDGVCAHRRIRSGGGSYQAK